MTAEHFVVLGVARARAPWSSEVGSWSTSSVLPIEFIRCVSVDEIRARLLSDRRHSAVLLDERCVGVDRDLIGEIRDARAIAIMVCGDTPLRDWIDLGAACVLREPLSPDRVLAALRDHALGIERRPVTSVSISATTATGRLVAVAGPGGSGTSIVAMALAGRFARSHSTALVDAALDADQALLHDLGDVLPGLPELVESHRTSTPSTGSVRGHLWSCPTRGYDILPGLRRHRDWSTMRRRNVLAALHSVRRAYELVIADTDIDVEGEEDTGSIDVEDRNVLARHLVATADVVVITARPGLAGVRRLLRNLSVLLDHGIDLRRVVPVMVGAPRSTARRSEVTRTITRLWDEVHPDAPLTVPVMVPSRRDLEPFLHDGNELPASTAASVGAAVDAVLRAVEPAAATSDPTPVIPGHLGRTA